MGQSQSSEDPPYIRKVDDIKKEKRFLEEDYKKAREKLTQREKEQLDNIFKENTGFKNEIMYMEKESNKRREKLSQSDKEKIDDIFENGIY